MFVCVKSYRIKLQSMLKCLAFPALLALVSTAALVGCLGLPRDWWYRFIPTGLSESYYTAGPLAIASNIRPDIPLWPDMAQLNLTQSRLTYAMTRGRPVNDIAWLYPESEWPDQAVIELDDFAPSMEKLSLSRALLEKGFSNDRVGVNNVDNLEVGNDSVRVGIANVSNLVINNVIGGFDEDAELNKYVAEKIQKTISPPALSDFVDASGFVVEDMFTWDVPPGDYQIALFHQNKPLHNLVGSAYPGALARSLVRDYLNTEGIDEYISELVVP